MKNSSYLPAPEDGTECSETSAYKIQTPGNYPEESVQHLEHGESLKSRSLPVNLRTTRFHIQEFYMVITLPLCVLCGSQKKQQTFPYTTFTDWSL